MRPTLLYFPPIRLCICSRNLFVQLLVNGLGKYVVQSGGLHRLGLLEGVDQGRLAELVQGLGLVELANVISAGLHGGVHIGSDLKVVLL